jgi:peroxiredoxin
MQESFVTGMENKPLVNFNVLLPDSTTYFNTSNLPAEKKVVLFYYSPTCPYCRAQMREMLNHIERYQNVQLCVVTNGDFKSMKEFNDYFKLQAVPNIITGVDTGSVFARNYQVLSVPFTATFDEQKRLKSAYAGRITGKTLLRITHP